MRAPRATDEPSLVDAFTYPEAHSQACSEFRRCLDLVRAGGAATEDVDRLVAGMRWRMRVAVRSSVRREWGPQSTSARHHALAVGVLLAVADERQPQRVRIGRKWIGHGADVVPVALTPATFARWLNASAVAHAESILCLPPDRYQRLLRLPSDSRGGELATVSAPSPRPHPLVDPDVALRLREDLSPQQRQIVDLSGSNLGRAQIAARLGTTRQTIRTGARRIAKAVRATLLADDASRARAAEAEARAGLGLTYSEPADPEVTDSPRSVRERGARRRSPSRRKGSGGDGAAGDLTAVNEHPRQSLPQDRPVVCPQGVCIEESRS